MKDVIYKISRKLLYNELRPLFEALEDINYAVVKGEVLSQQIYGEPDRRQSNDVDILIDKKNVAFLEEQLRKLGFEQNGPKDNIKARRNRVLCMAYSHQIPAYHKEYLGFHLNVDINYDIFWGEYEGERCSIEEFLSDTINMEIHGVTIKTLNLNKAFLQIILHHYKDMNSIYLLSTRNSINCMMFRDIYYLLSNNLNKITIEELYKLSNRYNINDYVYYMLYYTGKLFDDDLLNKFISAFKTLEGDELLSCYGLNSKERKKWNFDFETRLKATNIYDLIKRDLSAEDLEKINLNVNIFGEFNDKQ